METPQTVSKIHIASEAWEQFKGFCKLDFYQGNVWNGLVNIFAPDRNLAQEIWSKQRDSLALAASLIKCTRIQIHSPGHSRPIEIRSSYLNYNKRTTMTYQEPLITIPSLEIGELTLTPEILPQLTYMMENPNLITGITRVHDERQVIMSASSVALLTTTTLKKAVTRRRSEYWHPHDLFEFRARTYEFVRDLLNGTTSPEKTQIDVSWRCVSGNGSWRLITHQYKTFVDGNKIAYQLSRNIGIEAIDPPSDLVLSV